MWEQLAGAAIGGLLSGDSGGGSQTVSKEPWAKAAPWMEYNLQRGQDLQKQYEQNPFNGLQRGAYQNLFAGNDYINAMTPGLLAQFSQQSGFDRSNPQARPQAFQFPQMQAMGQPGGMQPMQGLLGASLGQAQAPAPMAAPATAAPPVDDQMRQWYQNMVAFNGAGG